jgi:hypothetical protein
MKNFKLIFGGKLLFSLFVAVFAGGFMMTNASAVEASGGNTTIERFSVPFSIPWSDLPCADLPPGVTEVSGIANFRLATVVRVDAGGVTYMNQNGYADGTATDNLGGNYRINYANHFDAEVPPDGFPQQIRMVDHFNLLGSGRNKMHVGFVITGTIENPDDTFPWHTTGIVIRGDAIGCDPI